jgi:hypothetical protein
VVSRSLNFARSAKAKTNWIAAATSDSGGLRLASPEASL